MKRQISLTILSLMVLCFLSLKSNAQDFGIQSMTKLGDGTNLAKGISYYPMVSLLNYGPKSLAAGTIINIYYEAGDTIHSHQIYFNQDIPVNQGVTIPPINPIMFPHVTPNGSAKVCVWIHIKGDSNQNNDTLCSTYNLYSTHRDAGVSAIDTPIANSTLVPGAAFWLSLTIKNFGDTTFTIGQIIPVAIIINNSDTINQHIIIPQTLISGATTTVPVFDTLHLSPTLPSSFSICVATQWDIDKNAANNQTCNQYTTKTSGLERISRPGQVTVSPNPFSGKTVIRYDLAKPGYVSLKVYDLTGKMVSSLVDGNQISGAHEIIYSKQQLNAGTYIYRLTTSGSVTTGKLEIR